MPKEKKRFGGWLIFWISLIIFLNAISVITNLIFTNMVAKAAPLMPIWMIYLGGIIALASIAFMIFLAVL